MPHFISSWISLKIQNKLSFLKSKWLGTFYIYILLKSDSKDMSQSSNLFLGGLIGLVTFKNNQWIIFPYWHAQLLCFLHQKICSHLFTVFLSFLSIRIKYWTLHWVNTYLALTTLWSKKVNYRHFYMYFFIYVST